MSVERKKSIKVVQYCFRAGFRVTAEWIFDEST